MGQGSVMIQARDAAAAVDQGSAVDRVAQAVATGASAETFLAGFDDGAVLPFSASDAVDWSVLRVSFLDVDWKGAPADATSTASPWALDRIEDELVAVVCEWAAALRGHAVLAESVWAEAVQVRGLCIRR